MNDFIKWVQEAGGWQIGVIVSNALLWYRMAKLEQRFDRQFVEVPKKANAAKG